MKKKEMKAITPSDIDRKYINTKLAFLKTCLLKYVRKNSSAKEHFPQSFQIQSLADPKLCVDTRMKGQFDRLDSLGECSSSSQFQFQLTAYKVSWIHD